MSNRTELANLVIKKIQEGQESLVPLMQEAQLEHQDMPDGVRLFYVVHVVISNPEKANWKMLMDNIEGLLKESTDGELHEVIFHNILETFSNAISNGSFAHSWITPHIGPLSRKYIESYDRFWKAKTPGF